MAMEGTVQTIEVSASPDDVYAIAIDLESYPEWISAFKSVEVLEEDTQGRPARVAFSVDIGIKQISYILRYDYELEDGFSWNAEEGDDIKAMEGSYRFVEADDGTTEVIYALKLEVGFKFPGLLRRQAEKQIISSALRGLKKRAQSS